MFPVSVNPYFHPSLYYLQSPFTNPEWALRASLWDPYAAQAYYRGFNPMGNIGDVSQLQSGSHQSMLNNPAFQHGVNPTQIGSQSQTPVGFSSPATAQSQVPIGSQVPLGFVPPSPMPLPLGFASPATQGHSFSSPYGFGAGSFMGHLSPNELAFGNQSGNYLSPEFQEFIRGELLRTGKAIRTIGSALENDNEQVKTQAQTALTAQFFYALGLLYTRGVIIPRDVPGGSSRADELSPTAAAESFGESLERFAREPIQFRSTTVGELIEKARQCFRVLATEGEQLERFKEDRFKIEKKRVSA